VPRAAASGFREESFEWQRGWFVAVGVTAETANFLIHSFMSAEENRIVPRHGCC
jgi:hypothetical protein